MIPDTFDARTVKPNQGMGKHPLGMHDFQITSTHLKETKDGKGAMLCVEFTSPAGMIERNYQLFNPSPDAVRIANEQLSALCHAVNIFQVPFPKNPDGTPNMEMAGHTLRGGRGRMEVAFQKGHEPTTENPSGGYVEVRKVFDAQGNEPGKAPANGSATQPQQPNNNWGNQQPNAQAQQPSPQQNNTGGAASPGWSSGPTTNPAQQQLPSGNKPSWA